MVATVLLNSSQLRLLTELKTHHIIHICGMFGKYSCMYRTLGVALEHRAALVGIKVQAATRSESASENRKCRAMFAQLRIPSDH